jgi:hypothetical protein
MVKRFINKVGRRIFKNVTAGVEKIGGNYSISDMDLWNQFGFHQHRDKKFDEFMKSIPPDSFDETLVSDMLGKEFSKKYPVEW